ncbi:uncharacterized protein LOC130826275 [Amaranthus tricolor]|uniref:uncharacterized protein LOC130826275 n=1 Tax=Amaranthus tricolor TaxID=29722 RepID=UPI002586CF50|nr:uncharacterized protein LOC130826275 [Amaranthus tricolor]
MLARNLTAAFSEQLRAVMNNNNPAPQQVLDDMADQIKDLRERIEPPNETPKSHESQDENSEMSRSSKRNKRRRERPRTHTSLGRSDPRGRESKTASQDARTYLESKKHKSSESIQSLVDRRREERKRAQLVGSSHPASPVTMPQNEDEVKILPGDPTPIISPMAPEILNIPNPGKIKIPNMAAFDGTSCPEEHLMAYKNLMVLHTTNPSLWCKFFPTTLMGAALTWYTSLPQGSIHNFAQLEGKFLGHFIASRRQEKSNFHLLSVTQLEGESISSYLKKFHEAVLEVTDLEESVALNALINGMKAQRLKFQLVESQVKTYAEAMKQCQSYVTASEVCQAHDPKRRKSDKKDAATPHQSSRNREEHQSRRERNHTPRRPAPPSDMGPPRSHHIYTAAGESRTRNLLDGGNDLMFNRNRRDIFFAVRDKLPTPPPTTTPSNRRNYNLWCDYHKEHGHTLAQCRELKRILYQLADEGKLSRFLNKRDYDAGEGANRRQWNQRRGSPKREEARREGSHTQGTINMIFGGYTEEYPTVRAAKDSVHNLLKRPTTTVTSEPVMKFDATTSQTLQQPHTDPLFEEKHLQPLDKPLIGFGGSQVIPLGTIILPVRVGERSESRTLPIRFTVVDLTFPYNAIMGLPLINKIKAAIYPHQLLLQFEWDDGKVGILKGDQITARQCLINTLKRGHSATPAKREREDQDAPAVMSVYMENLAHTKGLAP